MTPTTPTRSLLEALARALDRHPDHATFATVRACAQCMEHFWAHQRRLERVDEQARTSA